MATRMIVPSFATETEEADWWYENRERVSEEFALAAAEGRLGRGTAVRRAKEAQARMQEEAKVALDMEDIMRAQAAAKRRGMPYQDYVKMLVHEALEKEAAAA